MNLIAHFQSPSPYIVNIEQLKISWYGVIAIFSTIVAFIIARYLAKMRNAKDDLVIDFFIWALPFSLPFAHLYVVILHWDLYKSNLLAILGFYGGFAVHGLILGGIIVSMIFSRINRISFWLLVDVISPPFTLGLAIFRWGNFFNSEGYGIPTDLPWKLYIPLENRLPEYKGYEYFHPTFLYESLWNLGAFCLLMMLFWWGWHSPQKIKIRNGTIFCVSCLVYSFGRLWIQGFRLPISMVGNIHIAQIVSVIGIIFGILSLVWLYGYKRDLPDVIKPQ